MPIRSNDSPLADVFALPKRPESQMGYIGPTLVMSGVILVMATLSDILGYFGGYKILQNP